MPLLPAQLEAAWSPTDIISLGHSFRRVTELIEEVGRTLEAQNQRAQRLMERLEGLARSLEVLPLEAERQLEALDAVQRSIERSGRCAARPGELLRRELHHSLPEVVRAIRESSARLEQRWSEATRVLADRFGMVQAEAQVRAEERLAAWERRQRRRSGALAGAVAAALLAVGALLALQPASLLRSVSETLLGGGTVAAETPAPPSWQVTAVTEQPGAELPAGPSRDGEGEHR
ncbi:MAG: hypothetical protein KatS3mg102_1735 [Planctomycetota bacterium]|nr:MAG: hypothetical protein KatS3mg102_1735 [Planctomycetota bacterium]